MGSVHGDERGFERTLRLLGSLQPDLVLVELSPYGKAFRNRQHHTLQRTLNHNLSLAANLTSLTFRQALRHPEIKAIRRQLALPFEYRAARRYSPATVSALALVDSSRFSRKMIESWQELLSVSNLASLLTLPEDGRLSPEESYERAARTIREVHPWLQHLSGNDSSGADPLWEERERYMAGRIRRVWEKSASRKVVYLGGWQHLVANGPFPTLRDLLGIDLKSCYLLDRGSL